jgi:hypothetical protein
MPSETSRAPPMAHYQGHNNWYTLLIIQFKRVDQYTETNNYKHTYMIILYCHIYDWLSNVSVQTNNRETDIFIWTFFRPVVCRRVRVLCTLFVFVCVWWCAVFFLFFFICLHPVSCVLSVNSSSGLSICWLPLWCSLTFIRKCQARIFNLLKEKIFV